VSPNRKTTAFLVWFSVLGGTFSWALVEYTFPRSSYMPNPFPSFMAIGFSAISFGGIGWLLYSYLKEGEIRKKETILLFAGFLTVTFLLTSWLAPSAIVSASNMSNVQWCIEDLESQGFRVEYHAQYPYNRGPVSHVESYSDFTSLAKDLNCTYVLVYGGAPMFFMFDFPSNTVFLVNEHGQYLLNVSW
jgi:hypothetical protein